MSAIHGEDIEDKNNLWQIPTETDYWIPKQKELKKAQKKYVREN